MFLIVVDDGVGADVGYGFVFLVDGGVLGIDVGEIIRVIYINVAIPCVVIDCNIILISYARITKRLNKNRNIV